MELLTAVNNILPKLGEHPVTSLERKHPTLAIVLPLIDQVMLEVLGEGWWFNTFEYTAYPNSEKEIYLPSNTISFIPNSASPGAAVRGMRLYNTGNSTFLWDSPVTGVLIESMPFNQLPQSAANVVLYRAMIDSYVTDIGLEKEIQVWQGLSQSARAQLVSEHLRNRKFSARNSPRQRRLRSAMRG